MTADRDTSQALAEARWDDRLRDVLGPADDACDEPGDGPPCTLPDDGEGAPF